MNVEPHTNQTEVFPHVCDVCPVAGSTVVSMGNFERVDMKSRTEYDPRYAYVTCSKCGQKWQRLDYGCARHALTCADKGYGPLPPQVEPMPTTALTTEQWEQFDDANGIDNRIAKSCVTYSDDSPSPALQTIRKMNPNTYLPTGAELAKLLSKIN